jgi:hypothetical protein
MRTETLRWQAPLALRWAPLLILLTLVACQKEPEIKTWWKAHLDNIDTDGRARGVATQGTYAYVADREKGLKVFNIASPQSVKQVSVLDLPGWNTEVTAQGSVAVLNDMTTGHLYVADVSDKLKPQLKWTHSLAQPAQALALHSGVAFVLEQLGTGSETLEAVSCSLTQKPATLQSLAIKDAVDVDASATHVFVATKQGLTVLARSAQGFDKTPVGSLSLAPGDTLKSLDYSDGYLALLGQSVYLVDATNPTAPKLLDQKPVPGYAYHRDVALSDIVSVFWTGAPFKIFLFQPITANFMLLSYTTMKQYGAGFVTLPSGKLVDLRELYDVDADSNGKAKLYQVAMRQDIAQVLGSGGISRVGALDNYGLIYEWLEVFSLAPPAP